MGTSDLLAYWLPAGSFALGAALVALGTRPRARLIFQRFRDGYLRLASRKTLACLVVGALTIGLRLALLPIWPKPTPRVYDEFSYLLMADTFASGRLTNPSPPHWEHFETVFVQLWPTYQSPYPVAQGILLAIGKAFFGHPWWGVVLEMGLFAAAICWMAQAWLPPGWALLGTLLGVLQFGLASYWMNSYWGEARLR